MYRAVLAVARGMAVLGGLVLSALVLMTCVSVAGRAANKFLNGDWAQAHMTALADWLIAAGVAPVTGDVELVEAGVGFAIFAFLPLCQISGAHARVDIFTAGLGARANRAISVVVDVLFAAVLVVIAWRLQVGMAEKMRYAETTFMLQFPVWWAYGLSLCAAVVAALVGLFVAAARVAEAVTGRDVLPRAAGEAG